MDYLDYSSTYILVIVSVNHWMSDTLTDYSWDRLEELSNDNISKKSQVTLIETLRTIFPSLKVTRDHQQSHVHLAREMPLNSTC